MTTIDWGTLGNAMQVLGAIAAVILGVGRFIRRFDKRMDKLESNFVPNGGSSMRDAVDRIDKKIDRIDRDLANLSGRFTQHIEEKDK